MTASAAFAVVSSRHWQGGLERPKILTALLGAFARFDAKPAESSVEKFVFVDPAKMPLQLRRF